MKNETPPQMNICMTNYKYMENEQRTQARNMFVFMNIQMKNKLLLSSCNIIILLTNLINFNDKTREEHRNLVPSSPPSINLDVWTYI